MFWKETENDSNNEKFVRIGGTELHIGAPAYMKWWTNEQVLEAMFLAASREPDSRIRVVGQDEDGGLRFQINLRQADVSDASGKVTPHWVL